MRDLGRWYCLAIVACVSCDSACGSRATPPPTTATRGSREHVEQAGPTASPAGCGEECDGAEDLVACLMRCATEACRGGGWREQCSPTECTEGPPAQCSSECSPTGTTRIIGREPERRCEAVRPGSAEQVCRWCFTEYDYEASPSDLAGTDDQTCVDERPAHGATLTIHFSNECLGAASAASTPIPPAPAPARERGSCATHPRADSTLNGLDSELDLLRSHDQTRYRAGRGVLEAAQRVFDELELVGRTDAEVERLLGPPVRKAPDRGRTRWEYVFHDGEQGVVRWVYVDAGRVERCQRVPTE